MHEHGFRGVADAGALRFRVHHDLGRHLEIRFLIDINDADAVGMFDHRHARVTNDRFDQGMAAARNDEVDVTVHLRHVPDRFAIGFRNEQNAVGRQTGAGAAALQRLGDGDVRVDRLRSAAQDGGVAGLGAENGGVARHVRARFVDDADDADRDAHFGNVDSVRLSPAPAALRRPDRPARRPGECPRRFSRAALRFKVRRSIIASGKPAPGLPPGLSHSPPGSARLEATISSAIARRAAFFCALSSRARARAACRARCPKSRIRSRRSITNA